MGYRGSKCAVVLLKYILLRIDFQSTNFVIFESVCTSDLAKFGSAVQKFGPELVNFGPANFGSGEVRIRRGGIQLG